MTQSDQSWRRPLEMHAAGYETSGIGFADMPTPRWEMYGEHAEEDFLRVMQGLVCVRCWTPYPERLDKHSVARIMAECAPFGRPDDKARLLIAAGHCPVCATEVSPEMAQVFFQGVNDRPEAATLRQGEHGEYEHLIDDTPPLYLPPGWDR